MLKNNYDIKLLADCQEHLPTIAKLGFEAISRHWNPNASIEAGIQTYHQHLNRNSLPLTNVLLQNNQAIGMASLRETDGILPGVTPWLGSLVVDPNHRKAQLGERLINTVKDQAKLLGFSTLYLLAFDPTIPQWYARLGWEAMGEDELYGHPVVVMQIALR